MQKIPPREFLVQWHLTARCDQSCKFCYMKDSPTYNSELKNELSLEDIKKTIDDYSSLMKRWKMKGVINFTGGDPILRDDFFKIADYAVKKDLKFGILGNPYHVDDKTAKRLKALGILHYQLSLDGIEDKHDFFRKKGSFKDTIRAIRILKKNAIKVIIMFTLSKANKEDIFGAMEIADREGADIFDFARLVPTGCGKLMKDQILCGEECKVLFKRIDNHFNCLPSKMAFGRKDNLWRLYFYEKGQKYPENGLVAGCSLGLALSILADGIVFSCRRLPITVGKVPNNTLIDIIVNSKNMMEFRDISKFECSTCELCSVCRGCPAISYAITGDYTKKDAGCWKKEMGK